MQSFVCASHSCSIPTHNCSVTARWDCFSLYSYISPLDFRAVSYLLSYSIVRTPISSRVLRPGTPQQRPTSHTHLPNRCAGGGVSVWRRYSTEEEKDKRMGVPGRRSGTELSPRRRNTTGKNKGVCESQMRVSASWVRGPGGFSCADPFLARRLLLAIKGPNNRHTVHS